MNPIRCAIRLSIASAAAAVLGACGGNDAAPQATEVLEWNAFASDLVAASELPPMQARALAVVQIAVHDALNAIDARYEPHTYAGSAPGASSAAAVAAAVRDTLLQLVPAAAPAVQAKYDAKLASIPQGVAKDAGVATGQAAAAAILARRSGDDLFAALGKPYAAGRADPGVYQPTPPTGLVLGAGLGEVAPFGIASSGEFRSPAPLAVNSAEYARDYDELKDLGSIDSTARTPEQTQTGRFWYDAATKEWHAAGRKGLIDMAADERQAARTLALVGIAMFDAAVASFETKFAYDYWRPITAIRAGDDDGNDATRGEPAWEPLCVTPPWPDHNSTHAATGAAAAGVLAQTLGDSHTFSVDSKTLPGVSRTYQRFSDAAFEEGISRIYCGIHFRNAMDTGLAQGGQVAERVVGSLLRPIAR